MPPSNNTNNSKPTPATAVSAKATGKGAKPTNAEKTPSEAKPLVPPEPQFWQTYSPNGEFPFSSLGSLAIHGITLFILLGGVLALFSSADKGEELEPVLVGDGGPGGGGGDPLGVGDNPGDLRPKDVEETIEKPDPTKPIDKPDPEIDVKDKKTQIADDPDAQNIAKKAAVKPQVVPGMPSLKDSLAGVAGKGKGGSGQGGGFGSGVGKGVGDKWGTGPLNDRGRRVLRWRMIFNTNSGNDYIRQLNALGAILRLDQGDKTYIVRNLSERPSKPVLEDPSTINQIYWSDDDKASCQSVAEALQLSFTPDVLVVYFPVSLEKTLVKKELDYGRPYGRKKEEDIGETRFKIEFSRGAPVINVVYQEGKR